MLDLFQLLTTERAAEILGLKPGTLETWRWSQKGPPYVRLEKSGAIRYRLQDLQDWVEGRIIDPKPKRGPGRPRKDGLPPRKSVRPRKSTAPETQDAQA